MPILKIRIYGDPVLKKKAASIERVGPEEKKLFEDMANTMYLLKGVGLAATQVGVEKQMMVIDVGCGLLKLANPKVVKASCKRSGEEGCLSFPEIIVKISRPEKIVAEALNHEGKKIRIEAEGLLARALQHELDHLSGVVIIDKIGIRQRLFIAKKLARLKKMGKSGITR